VEPLTLTVAFEAVEDGWVQARIVEIPGVITAGRDRAEARELVVDALREYLLAAGHDGPEALGEQEQLTLQVRSA
jgi:predicted RNase H-like HicB family nuclease